jgi:hypothetical protein
MDADADLNYSALRHREEGRLFSVLPSLNNIGYRMIYDTW